jgi:hypothetical protein
MGVLFDLVIPLAVTLVAGAVLFGGRAARPMAIGAFVLGVFAACLVLVHHL